MEGAPFDDDARAQIASILMETRALRRRPDASSTHPAEPGSEPDVDVDSSALRRADRATLPARECTWREATAIVDRMISIPAYTRSWYHMRDAQLAFEAGDTDDGERGVRRSAAHLSGQRDGAALPGEALSRAPRLGARAGRGATQRGAVSASASARLRSRRAACARRRETARAAPMRSFVPSSGSSMRKASTTGFWRCTMPSIAST